jgi:hypothetical protein
MQPSLSSRHGRGFEGTNDSVSVNWHVSRNDSDGAKNPTVTRTVTLYQPPQRVCDDEKATPITQLLNHAKAAAASSSSSTSSSQASHAAAEAAVPAAAATTGPCPIHGSPIPDTWLLLQHEELQAPLTSEYHRFQSEVHPTFRTSLVNWLTQLHSRYNMRDETLFRAVDILDRLLNNRDHRIARSWLQVMGLAAFLMASKMEDSQHPVLEDLVALTDHAVSKEQLSEAEATIAKRTNMRLVFPLSSQFLQMLLSTFQASQTGGGSTRQAVLDELHQRAHYLLELSLHDNASLDYRPSMVAAAAFMLAQVTMPSQLEDPRQLASIAGRFERVSGGYSLLDLSPCMLHLHKLVQRGGSAESSSQQHYVVRKYSKQALGAVATKRFDLPLTTTPPPSPLLALLASSQQSTSSSSNSSMPAQWQLSVVDRDYSFG